MATTYDRCLGIARETKAVFIFSWHSIGLDIFTHRDLDAGMRLVDDAVVPNDPEKVLKVFGSYNVGKVCESN